MGSSNTITRKTQVYVCVSLLSVIGVVYLLCTLPLEAAVERLLDVSLGRRLLLVISLVSSTCGMEYYSRFAHQHQWHNPSSWLFAIHQTHHTRKSRHEWFERNDVLGVLNFAIVFGPLMWSFYVPEPTWGSLALLGLCSGISIYGTAYMLVHDGVHHQRFPVFFGKDIAWIRQIADAHAHHHTAAMGPPYGLFLGPHEWRAHQAGVPPDPMPWWLKMTCAGCTATAVVGLVCGV